MFQRKLITQIAKKLKGNSCGLKTKLLAENKTRWLDIGGSNVDEGFYCLNLPSVTSELDPELGNHYFSMSILELTEEDYQKLGKFDLIRMQHVFEHFSFEEGHLLLKICSRLLRPDGYLLITVPDLMVHLQLYFLGYKFSWWYKGFAIWCRLPEDVPPSCFFSVYAHQDGYKPLAREGEAHKWCYDYKGLEYQVKKVNEFKNIRKLGLLHPLAGLPFTHNRPMEDVCILAQKI